MLKQRDGYWYGDGHPDIHEELVRYGSLNGYPINHFVDVTCSCGGRVFPLTLDDSTGAEVRSCGTCHHEHPIGDSDEYLDEAALQECACPCGNEQFEISAGVSLFKNSQDVRWFYLGCRCSECGLTAMGTGKMNSLAIRSYCLVCKVLRDGSPTVSATSETSSKNMAIVQLRTSVPATYVMVLDGCERDHQSIRGTPMDGNPSSQPKPCFEQVTLSLSLNWLG